ncbi:MAG: hypothetical protein NVSMB31_04910 [Vulcanimicrobiaceae bacterium]
MRLYRTFPYDPNAAERDPGGALFVPPGGAGRIDNPDLYRTFYASSDPAGSIAEVFGIFPYWDSETFAHANGHRYTLATYDAPDGPFFDLDNPANLMKFGIKPSEVVMRDRKLTQQWARNIFLAGSYIGIKWWSFYGPQWSNLGIWEYAAITLAQPPDPLHPKHGAVLDAANQIVRLIRA